jgi:flagellar biosynthesis protein FlhA
MAASPAGARVTMPPSTTPASAGGLKVTPNTDLMLAVGMTVILATLFLPVPALLIDLGLAFSIALSVVILMVALWIKKPLDFSAFPTVLLIATMLRLSLNIATTRLILSEGNSGETAAGHIISGFANLVMNGDFVIGVIVFLILITVNFMVITKGATRIAEVGARFTLDAIPGKQMAIDADLSAGLIDEKEAQRRRMELEEESSFFGAMDGASKFVRGRCHRRADHHRREHLRRHHHRGDPARAIGFRGNGHFHQAIGWRWPGVADPCAHHFAGGGPACVQGWYAGLGR